MDFSLSDAARNRIGMSRMAAEGLMRPISRQFDEEEHTDPWEFFNTMWEFSRSNRDATGMGGQGPKEGPKKGKGKNEGTLLACMQIEELAWGDAGLYLSIPNPGLGRAGRRHCGAEAALPRNLL
jgi:acyl-CoA dehydrogenase